MKTPRKLGDTLGTLAAFGGSRAVTSEPRSEWPPITPELRIEVERVLESRTLSIRDGTGVLGAFESRFAEHCGSLHALAFCNGTAALHAALFAVGVRPGDEVVVPTLTWPATANAVLLCGAKPVFCDVAADTMCATHVSLRARVSPATRALLFVHLWGQPAGVVESAELARELGLPLVEDASHAHGSHLHGRKAGTFGAVGCFSLQSSKILAAGEAGVAVTDRSEHFDAMLALGHFGGRIERDSHGATFADYAYTGLGPKHRPHPLAMAIAVASLGSLEGWIGERHARIEALSQRLRPIRGLIVPGPDPERSKGAYSGYRIRNRPDVSGVPTPVLVALLHAEGVAVSGEWYQLLHRQPLYRGGREFVERTGSAWPYGPGWEMDYVDEDFPNACQIASEALAVEVPTLCDFSLIDEYGDAFEKVFQALDRLDGQRRRLPAFLGLEGVGETSLTGAET